MFENSGGKLRTIATIEFVLMVILAVIMLVVSVIGGSVIAGLFAAAIYILGGWIAALNLHAIADAADYAEQAAHNTEEILRMIRKGELGTRTPEAPTTTTTTGSIPVTPQGNVPAWKRVELERQNQQ